MEPRPVPPLPRSPQRPVRDLHALIPDQAYASVIDLGCGTGEHTLTLARRFPQAQVTGLDQSAEMLERAQAQQAPTSASGRATWAAWTTRTT